MGFLQLQMHKQNTLVVCNLHPQYRNGNWTSRTGIRHHRAPLDENIAQSHDIEHLLVPTIRHDCDGDTALLLSPRYNGPTERRPDSRLLAVHHDQPDRRLPCRRHDISPLRKNLDGVARNGHDAQRRPASSRK